MNLGMAVTRCKNELQRDLVEQLEWLINKKKEEGKTLVTKEYYVYTTSSIKKCSGCVRFTLYDAEEAIKFFMKKCKIKSKRLYTALGVEYVVDGKHVGAEDLLITGTDY